MRDIGYSFETALADVIDNSIAAGADRIKIFAPPEYPLIIGIIDNGNGLTEAELVNAFILSLNSPEKGRPQGDLGRFGLGMKTASWSQCRKVTLVSSINGNRVAASLDLDIIKTEKKWNLEILGGETIQTLRFIDHLDENGTLLIWEKLDRVDQGDEDTSKGHLRKLLSDAQTHLQLVFHRFLENEHGYNKIQIHINNNPLMSENPFFANHPATQIKPVEVIHIPEKGDVKIQTYTLPHHNKVSAAEWVQMARKEGHLKNQGFYLYRERRLILWGTWFGLMRQQELYKLTRVKIDIPNTMDEDWQINIMKSSARPPGVVAGRLSNILKTLGAPSRKVYRNRGEAYFDKPFVVWQKVKAQNMISYRIEETHPVISAFKEHLDEQATLQLQHVLNVIAASLPIDAFYSDLGTSPELVNVAIMADDDVMLAVEEILPDLLDVYSNDYGAVLSVLKSLEPYRSNIDVVERIIQEKISNG
jgi:hypothetical protein